MQLRSRTPVHMLPHSVAHSAYHASSPYSSVDTLDCLCARTVRPIFCKAVLFPSTDISRRYFHSSSLSHTITFSLSNLASSPRTPSSSEPFFDPHQNGRYHSLRPRHRRRCCHRAGPSQSGSSWPARPPLDERMCFAVASLSAKPSIAQAYDRKVMVAVADITIVSLGTPPDVHHLRVP
ncbi:hypothetical protein L1887_60200 [Cichorium endivia]|nr:hypothetical protein L1887_60200 [Cichorium endivia]